MLSHIEVRGGGAFAVIRAIGLVVGEDVVREGGMG
jgi:hypothetical protein